MFRRFSFAPFFALAIVGAACSSDSALTYHELPAELSEAFCVRAERCLAPGALSDLFRAVVDAPARYDCRDQARDGSIGLAPEQTASLEAGRIVFDESAAADCLATLRSSCADFEMLLASEASCRASFVGTVGLGATCTLDEDCMGDTYCDFSNSPDGCTGSCAATLPIGAPCDDARQCALHADGLVACEPTATNNVDHCVLVRQLESSAGGPCGRTDGDGDDQTEASCRPGLYCRAGVSSTGTCATPLALLAACNPVTDACVTGAVCAPNGVSGDRCEQATIVTREGDACDASSLDICQPFSRLVCGSGTCDLIGTGEIGQPCRVAYASDCNTGLACRATGLATAECRELGDDGDACQLDSECKSRFCDDVTVPASPVCGGYVCE